VVVARPPLASFKTANKSALPGPSVPVAVTAVSRCIPNDGT